MIFIKNIIKKVGDMMYNFCADCKNMNTKFGEKGLYKCSVTKSNVLANQNSCSKFSKSYSRTNYDKQKLCDEAKEYENTYYSGTVGGSLILLVILIILLIIFKICGILMTVVIK